MILRSYSAWLVPIALTLASFGTGGAKAIAQTTYPFEATYNAQITNKPTSLPNVFQTTVTGESPDAPYGLTNLTINNYSTVDFNTGQATYDSDPARFGLEDVPFGTLTLSDSDDKLFGTNSGTASLEAGSGTINITGGEGRFVGASGSLDLSQIITSNPDPSGVTAPIISPATISGSFQAVPEPRSNATIIGIGVLGVGFLLRQHRQRSIL